MGVSAFNFIDRQIVVILQESIKADLGLSDTQLGLLSGFVFSIFYVTMGIPVARLADRFNRKNIVSICLVFWSAITFLSGFVANFTQLLIARIGVGIGEAGGSPPSHSIISDYYPPEERSTALSVFSMGVYLGIMIGLLVGGIIDRFFGWRAAFMVVGLPGVLFALILYYTVREPVRGSKDSTAETAQHMSFRKTLMFIIKKRTFIYLAMGGAFVAFVQYGVGNWIPPFLSRYHGMNNVEIGILTALIFGIGGAIGTYLGGYLTDRWASANVSWYFIVPLIGGILSIPFTLLLCFIQDLYLASFLLVFPVILNALYLAPSLAVAHNLVPSHMRALSSAVFFFILNLIGLGMGPLFIGALSDFLQQYYGADSLRWSLAAGSLMVIVGVVFYALAARTVRTELVMYRTD